MTTRDPFRLPTHVAGNGELPSWWSTLDRRRLAVALGSTFIAVPVVVLDNLPQRQGAQAEAEEVAAVAGPSTTAAPTTLPPPSSTTITVQAVAAPTTTTATTAAARPATTTTAAPATTTTAAPTTTTTAPPTTTTAPPNRETGGASWYEWRDGECAHKSLPRGTVVTVTSVSNGRSVTCVVTDRGPFPPGRIIDLDDDSYAQLAPLSSGLHEVTLTW